MGGAMQNIMYTKQWNQMKGRFLPLKQKFAITKQTPYNEYVHLVYITSNSSMTCA